jgi:hypothetical protein
MGQVQPTPGACLSQEHGIGFAITIPHEPAFEPRFDCQRCRSEQAVTETHHPFSWVLLKWGL